MRYKHLNFEKLIFLATLAATLLPLSCKIPIQNSSIPNAPGQQKQNSKISLDSLDGNSGANDGDGSSGQENVANNVSDIGAVVKSIDNQGVVKFYYASFLGKKCMIVSNEFSNFDFSRSQIVGWPNSLNQLTSEKVPTSVRARRPMGAVDLAANGNSIVVLYYADDFPTGESPLNRVALEQAIAKGPANSNLMLSFAPIVGGVPQTALATHVPVSDFLSASASQTTLQSVAEEKNCFSKSTNFPKVVLPSLGVTVFGP